jgi:hypothetical protein
MGWVSWTKMEQNTEENDGVTVEIRCASAHKDKVSIQNIMYVQVKMKISLLPLKDLKHVITKNSRFSLIFKFTLSSLSLLLSTPFLALAVHHRLQPHDQLLPLQHHRSPSSLALHEHALDQHCIIHGGKWRESESERERARSERTTPTKWLNNTWCNTNYPLK